MKTKARETTTHKMQASKAHWKAYKPSVDMAVKVIRLELLKIDSSRNKNQKAMKMAQMACAISLAIEHSKKSKGFNPLTFEESFKYFQQEDFSTLTEINPYVSILPELVRTHFKSITCFPVDFESLKSLFFRGRKKITIQGKIYEGKLGIESAMYMLIGMALYLGEIVELKNEYYLPEEAFSPTLSEEKGRKFINDVKKNSLKDFYFKKILYYTSYVMIYHWDSFVRLEQKIPECKNF